MVQFGDGGHERGDLAVPWSRGFGHNQADVKRGLASVGHYAEEIVDRGVNAVVAHIVGAEVTGYAVNFPMIADPDRAVAGLYGMLHPNADDTATVRSVFIIGPDNKLKLSLTYPASTGRNFQEILRVLDSLQLTAQYAVATPADWQDGQDVIVVPSLSDEAARARFPRGFVSTKPYLR